jgi:tetratricopeptide (TPR) repeat protein
MLRWTEGERAMGASDALDELQSRAAAAFAAGRLAEARARYEELLAQRPERVGSRLQLALVAKYQRDWPASLANALEALRLGGGLDEAARWTAGIAATALGDWVQARAQWRACGIELRPGAGPIEESFGPVAIRLNPGSAAETVFAHRIDPARARIANVPLPGSGHRYRDLVLHDGAQVGQRHWHEQRVPVFNELQRLEPSAFATFTVFVVAEGDEDIEALQRMRGPGVGLVEDWTPALGRRCLRCADGIAHRHRWHEASHQDWNPDRSLGIAAESESSVHAMLEQWQAEGGARRRVEAIDPREAPPPALQSMGAWWQGPSQKR